MRYAKSTNHEQSTNFVQLVFVSNKSFIHFYCFIVLYCMTKWNLSEADHNKRFQDNNQLLPINKNKKLLII